MSDTRIKDITTEASDYADDDYLVMDGLTNGTRKVSAEKIAGAKVGMFGDAYDDTKTYPISSYCIYNDTVYINIDPVTSPEPFDSTKWEATTIDKELLKRYPIQRILKDDYDDLSYEEKNNGTIYIILDEDSPEDTLIWDTIGRGTLEIGDDIIDGVNELKQSLSNFGNIKVYQFFNTATLAIDLGFTPTSAKNGNAIMFNGNQGSAAIFRLDTSPSALNIAGSKTWTCTQSGSVVTFTANSTLWGVTTVIVDHN